MGVFWYKKMIEKYYKITLVGGAKGTGKSTISKKVSETIGTGYLHTGTLFSEAGKDKEIYERILLEKISGFSGIIDTHYAGYHADGFCKGISSGSLRNFQKTNIGIILIDLDAETLYDRRAHDDKKRVLDKKHISEELYWNRKYFNEYCDELGIEGKILVNDGLERTISEVIKYIGGKNG